MKRPWLQWSRRDFQRKMLPLVALKSLAYWVALPLVSPTFVRIALTAVLAIISIVLLYVTFSWAAAHDRRNPPWGSG